MSPRETIAELRRQLEEEQMFSRFVAFDYEDAIAKARAARAAPGLRVIRQKQAQSKRPADDAILATVNGLRAAWPGSADEFWQLAAAHFTSNGWPVQPKYLRNVVSQLRRG